MDLDRGKIERTDFASARRGYEPAEVDAHLREVADAVEDLRAELESQAERSSSLSGAASERLRLILDAAEASATEIRSDAEDEARQTVREARREARATTEEAERRASQREEESETAKALLDRMRTAAGGAIEGLRGEAEALRTELEEVSGSSGASGAGRSQRAAVDEEDSDIGDTVIIEPAVGAEPSGDEVLLEPEPGPDDVLIEEEELVVVEEEDVFVADEDPGVTTGRSAPQRPASGRSTSTADVEGARLIALNMALSGSPRAETADYLRETFGLEDDALLDDVYERVQAS
ncbi:MAG: DivIVA domain-containing protein [Thermoleophilaceae bacterium]|nr:DivIVA domain-containing protein [Thermoleophilaceae bacterium]